MDIMRYGTSMTCAWDGYGRRLGKRQGLQGETGRFFEGKRAGTASNIDLNIGILGARTESSSKMGVSVISVRAGFAYIN